jgi:predicted permease
MIPAVNLLCISVFAFADSDTKINARSITGNIATNPLILACLSGMLWNKFGMVLPESIVSVLSLISAAALPLGLLSVGAGVYMRALGNSIKPFVLSSFIKLFLSPLLAYLLCVIFDLRPAVTMVIVVMASLPTASSAYILSRELGGDSEVMAALIAGQTLAAIVCMPLVLNFLI